MASILLHIGTEKTGTTALQHWLHRNARTLWRRHRILYPRQRRLAQGCAHHPLSAALLPPQSRDFLSGAGEARAIQLYAELDQLIRRSGARQVVLSAEHLSSRLDADGIQRLRAMLHGHDVRVVAYVRWQDEMAISHFSTALRCGQREWFNHAAIERGHRSYHPWRMASDWAAIFGQANVDIRSYRDASRQGLERDFSGLLDIDADDTLGGIERRNTGMSLDEARLLHQLNQQLPTWQEAVAAGQPELYRRAMRLRTAVLRRYRHAHRNDQPQAPMGALLTPLQRSRLLEIFNEENQQLASRYRLQPPAPSSRPAAAVDAMPPGSPAIGRILARCLADLGIAGDDDRPLALPGRQRLRLRMAMLQLGQFARRWGQNGKFALLPVIAPLTSLLASTLDAAS